MLNLRNSAYPDGTIISHNGQIEEISLWDLTRSMREAQKKKAAQKRLKLVDFTLNKFKSA